LLAEVPKKEYIRGIETKGISFIQFPRHFPGQIQSLIIIFPRINGMSFQRNVCILLYIEIKPIIY